MRLLRLAGLPKTVDALFQNGGGDDVSAALEILEEHAQMFLKVGSLTFKDWCQLTTVERTAFLRAREKADITAAAAPSATPLTLAERMRPFDGGSTFRRMVITQATRDVVEAIRGQA